MGYLLFILNFDLGKTGGHIARDVDNPIANTTAGIKDAHLRPLRLVITISARRNDLVTVSESDLFNGGGGVILFHYLFSC